MGALTVNETLTDESVFSATGAIHTVVMIDALVETIAGNGLARWNRVIVPDESDSRGTASRTVGIIVTDEDDVKDIRVPRARKTSSTEPDWERRTTRFDVPSS